MRCGSPNTRAEGQTALNGSRQEPGGQEPGGQGKGRATLGLVIKQGAELGLA